MDTPQPTNPWEPTPSAAVAPEAPAPKRRPGRAIAYIAAGAIGATAITGIAFAANNTPSPTPNTPGQNAPDQGVPGDRDGDGPGGPGMMGGNGGPGMMGDRDGDGGPGGHHRGGPGGPRGFDFGGRVQHGEAVVTMPDGTTQNVRVQSGTVKSVSDTQLVVTSDDGTEWTWPITAETKVHKSRNDAKASDIAVGDKAMVFGTVSGDTVTTLRVGALTADEAKAMEQRRAERQQQRQQGGQQDQQGAPTTAGTSA